MPTVTEPRSWPSGLPIAIAQSPTRSWSESPSGSIGRLIALDLDHGDVGLGIGADDLGLERAAIVERHRDVVGVAHDVVVGQHVTLGVDDEPEPELGHALAGAC